MVNPGVLQTIHPLLSPLMKVTMMPNGLQPMITPNEFFVQRTEYSWIGDGNDIDLDV